MTVGVIFLRAIFTDPLAITKCTSGKVGNKINVRFVRKEVPLIILGTKWKSRMTDLKAAMEGSKAER